MPRFSFSLYTEKLSALLAILWGIWVLVFSAERQMPAYSGLDKHVSIHALSVLLIACGIALLIFSWLDWAVHPVHLVLFGSWLLVALSFLVYDFKNTGGVVYLIVSLHHVGGYYQRFCLHVEKQRILLQ